MEFVDFSFYLLIVVDISHYKLSSTEHCSTSTFISLTLTLILTLILTPTLPYPNSNPNPNSNLTPNPNFNPNCLPLTNLVVEYTVVE